MVVPTGEGQDAHEAAAFFGALGADPATFVDALLRQSPLGVGVFDPQCRYVQANEALQRTVGRGIAEMTGCTVADLVPGPIGSEALRLMEGVVRTGTPVVGHELTGPIGEDGRQRTFIVSYFRLTGPDGAVLGVASVVSDVTEQRHTRQALLRANQRLRLLQQAGAVLSESLDLEHTLDRLADLLVPALGDHCLVDLVADDGLCRVAVRHAPGAEPGDLWAEVGATVRYPHRHPVAQALAAGRALVTSIDPETFDFSTVAPSEGSARFAQQVGVRSVLTVPLWARTSVVGVISIASSTSGRFYTDDDLALATQLADRAAVAIDNARLFRRQQHVALALQRHLLPDRLPAAPGVQAAARYLPATAEGGEVGGDWYDVVPLPAGRVAVIVGDVMGRGLPAAALMGQVRAALRAYAVQDLPPGHVLACADELVRDLAGGAIVTCVYAVYDSRDGRLTLANAGHVPPLVAGGDGVIAVEATGPPLGAGDLASGRPGAASPSAVGPGSEEEVYTTAVVDLPSGGVLAVYTDGLIENRDRDASTGIAALSALLRQVRPGESLLEACDQLVTGLRSDAAGGPGGDPPQSDDVALLLVRPEPRRPDLLVREVPPLPEEVAGVRRAARQALRDWGVGGEVADGVQLVVSELVTNAVRYTGSAATLRVSRHDDGVVVEVCDRGSAPPRWRRAALDDEGGRGLWLVSTLSRAWGVRALPDGGKAVWCRL